MGKIFLSASLCFLLLSCSAEPLDCGNQIYKINAEFDTLINTVKNDPDAYQKIQRLKQARQLEINKVYSTCQDIHNG